MGRGDTAQERRVPNKSCLFTHRVIRSPWKGLFFSNLSTEVGDIDTKESPKAS